MRWIGFGALVLSACSLLACGGTTINGSNTGGSGGTGATSSGGTGGTGGTVGGCTCSSGYHCQIVSGSYQCVADPSTGGAGGSAGTAGAAGAGGSGGTTSECSAALEAGATPDGAEVGFGSSDPGSNAAVAKVSVNALLLKNNSGVAVQFKWVGPDLTGHFTQGEPVVVGRKDGWDYVGGLSTLAVARSDFGFVAPQEIPPIPMAAGPQLTYGTQCTFTEASGGCGQPPGTVKLLTVDATTGAGIVSAGQNKTIQFMAWQIHNDRSAQYPGYSSNNCVVEAGFASVITALGPSPINGGP